jgi:DNA-binding response OmpR family regulator
VRILVVEDEPKVARFIERGLKEEHFSVDVADDGEEGLYKAVHDHYDLVILDLLLPKINGLEVLRKLRSAGSAVRVLLLTARDGIDDRVQGLDAGADDYLVKPFAFAELLARVRALLRRRVETVPEVIEFHGLRVDTRRHKVSRDGKPISLTSKEYAVLAHLAQHPEEIVSRTRLAESVWDEQYDPFSNVIEVTVYHLRDKVDRSFARRLIHTVRGAGYVLRLEG